MMVIFGIVSDLSSQQSSALREEVAYTIRVTEQHTQNSLNADRFVDEKTLDAQMRRDAKKITVRSMRFIILHERFGRNRARVIDLWSWLKMPALGTGVLVQALNSKDSRLRFAAITSLEQYGQKADSRAKARIAEGILPYHDRRPWENTRYKVLIWSRSTPVKAIGFMQQIAIQGNRDDRDEAIRALLAIGTPEAKAAVKEVVRRMEIDLEWVKSKQ